MEKSAFQATYTPCTVDESVGGDPTRGRAMTTEDGEAGELVVKLRNLVAQLEDECEALRDELDRRDDPNRFGLYEALDTVLRCVSAIVIPGDSGFAAGDIDTIQKQVYALRAYITGMER